MKEAPRLYSNTWMAFVLAIASVLWLLSATPLRSQSGGGTSPGGNAGGNSQTGGQSQGQGNQGGNAGGNSQAGGQSQGQGNQGGNAGGNSQAGGQSHGQGNQGGNAGGNFQAGGQSHGQGNRGGNAGGNSQAGGQSQGHSNQGGNAGGNGKGKGPQGNNRGGKQPSGGQEANSEGSQQEAENGQPGNKDSLTVEALASTGSAGNVSPATPSDESNQWRYAMCLPANSSLSQTFPVRFKLENTNGTPSETATILLDAAGRLADAAAFPDELTITDNGALLTQPISVVTPALDDGAYNLNLQIRARPARRVHPPHATIHIHVLVGSACEETSQTSGSGGSGTSAATTIQPTGPSFFTDDEFNLLENCAGQPVSGGSGGTFQIAARPNAATIASTDPDQFYYNLIWGNPGATQSVSINLSASNLEARGRNAVHAMVFDSNGFVASFQNWDMTNDDGTACGPSGPCTLTVESGKKLWVTWRLEFAGQGDSSAGIANTCAAANKTISATGTLKDSSGATLATGTATATGYLK